MITRRNEKKHITFHKNVCLPTTLYALSLIHQRQWSVWEKKSREIVYFLKSLVMNFSRSIYCCLKKSFGLKVKEKIKTYLFWCIFGKGTVKN